MIRVYNTKEDEVFNIPLTPEAARSPQILSSFMKRSQTLSHDPFFFTPPSMTPVASPSVKKALSVFIAVGPEHQEENLSPAYVPSKLSSACHRQDPPSVSCQPESSAFPCQHEDLLSTGPHSIDCQLEPLPPAIEHQLENPGIL